MRRLEIQGVGKRFGKVVALNDVSLSVAPGEFCVLLGPSGCGKSTLLRIIAGLEPPDRGEIVIDGRRVTELEPKDRDVSMVFQNYALYPHMTVYENISFPLRVGRVSREETDARVRDAAELLQIEELLPRKPRELSGGQRQRVAIGRAIVRRPKLFLFDEPLSNLDARLRLSMRAELARLHRHLNATVIYVTHDQVEAMTLGTRIALMNAGRFEQVGSPAELYESPETRFVATFLGSPAMNMISGRLEGGTFEGAELRLKLEGADGSVTLGVRPEDLEFVDDGPWIGEVDLVENLGAESILHIRCGSALLVARVAGKGPPGAREKIVLRPRLIHLFDSSGKRVTRASDLSGAPDF